MKQKILYAVLASISAMGGGAAVRSDAVTLGAFDSTVARASVERIGLDPFQSFVWLRTEALALPKFNSNPVRGLLLIIR